MPGINIPTSFLNKLYKADKPIIHFSYTKMVDENILNAFLSILALFTALGILYIIVKRMSAKGKLPGFPNNLKIISKLSLQPKTNLFIVKAGEKTLLIGVSGNSISMLADLTESNNKDYTEKVNYNVPQYKMKEELKLQGDASKSTLSFREFIRTSLKKTN